jgi:putative membrane protein
MKPWKFRSSHALVLLIGIPIAQRAFAHGDEEIPENARELFRSWAFEPGIVIPLAFTAMLYALGLWRTWKHAGARRGIRAWEAGAFAGGWIALVIALVSPLHPWGRVLFSAHMAQHEILMLVAAPLLVLGKPMVVMLRALPRGWSSELARLGNGKSWQSIWRVISNAMVAWLIHAVILWMWHAPILMDAVLEKEWVHALQHLSFFLSAVLFWWAVIHGRQRAAGYGVAVLYMFTTALHSGLLGALLTFANTLWYPPYANTTQSWGITPVEDQQLGGLMMWVPACTIYIVAGLALLAAWMRESESRMKRRETISMNVPSTGLEVAE